MMTRRQDRSTRRSDALIGYLIPLFFMGLAVYQQVTAGEVDKYVIGCLLVFGLGALGWRIDVLFEKYLDSKSQRSASGLENNGRS